jgi:hypothetical protein
MARVFLPAASAVMPAFPADALPQSGKNVEMNLDTAGVDAHATVAIGL